jgi:hypothetical protein
MFDWLVYKHIASQRLLMDVYDLGLQLLQQRATATSVISAR